MSQKRLAPCCMCTCGKRPKYFIEDMNFETRLRCGTCVHHQNRAKRGSRANCQRWERLSPLITFKFSAKITHTPGILTPGDFHPDRSGGHVVPRWKSPDVVVDCEFGWKSPDVIVSVSLGDTYVMVSVSSGENHPALWLVWVWGENHPTLWLEWVSCFPVNALALYKLTKFH